MLQGFREFCKVADMFVKAPDVTYFCAAIRLSSDESASLKKNTQKRCFQRVWKPSIHCPDKAAFHSNSL